MRLARHVIVFVVLLAALPFLAAAQTADVIADVRVHGNHVTSNEQVLKMAGVSIGAPFTATTLQEVERRLRDSGKFDTVEVLKRFASIADPTQIARAREVLGWEPQIQRAAGLEITYRYFQTLTPEELHKAEHKDFAQFNRK